MTTVINSNVQSISFFFLHRWLFFKKILRKTRKWRNVAFMNASWSWVTSLFRMQLMMLSVVYLRKDTFPISVWFWQSDTRVRSVWRCCGSEHSGTSRMERRKDLVLFSSNWLHKQRKPSNKWMVQSCSVSKIAVLALDAYDVVFKFDLKKGWLEMKCKLLTRLVSFSCGANFVHLYIRAVEHLCPIFYRHLPFNSTHSNIHCEELGFGYERMKCTYTWLWRELNAYLQLV